MSRAVKGVYIVSAKRTPFGTYGGKFKNTSSVDLQIVAAKAALADGKINPDLIDSVCIGNVLPNTSVDGIFVPRHVLLRSGIPKEKPALGVNRLCGSGFQAIISSTQDIEDGLAKISLAGGTENMSQTPYTVRNIRFGTTLGVKTDFEDSLWAILSDTYCNLSMGLTAEKLGEQCSITREEVDKFALQSQQNWKKAQETGVFKAEIAPVPITEKKKEVIVDVDEHPRPQTTIEGLQKLKPVFKKDGLVTAGTASGISDGAGAVVLANEEALTQNNLTPLARLIGYSVVGVEPSIMGIGPVPAIQNVLKICGKTLNDIDLIEINEAFGAQTLACAKKLGLDMNRLNVNGGAIAIGHPLGASGARLTAHLVHELRRRKVKLGVGAACIGGGQGIAVLLEAL